MVKKNRSIHQKKSLSQVFLKDSWPCDRVASELKDWDITDVLEIGPGKGILTKALLQKDLHVTAVEKDPRFFDYLSTEDDITRNHLVEGNLELINEDILQFDIARWVSEKKTGRLAVCGNIPYHISSAIIQYLFSSLPQLKVIYLMVQAEFAERLASPPSSKSYGSLSVYTQLRSEAKIEFSVPKTEFFPVPKVDSSFITLKPLSSSIEPSILKGLRNLRGLLFLKEEKN